MKRVESTGRGEEKQAVVWSGLQSGEMRLFVEGEEDEGKGVTAGGRRQTDLGSVDGGDGSVGCCWPVEGLRRAK